MGNTARENGFGTNRHADDGSAGSFEAELVAVRAPAEVLALHHAGVRAPQQTQFGGYLNEGVRISRILQFVRGQ